MHRAVHYDLLRTAIMRVIIMMNRIAFVRIRVYESLLPFTSFISFTLLLPLLVLFSFPANLHASDRDLSPAIKHRNLGEWPLGLSPMARPPSFSPLPFPLFFAVLLSASLLRPREMRAKGRIYSVAEFSVNSKCKKT